jgi:magnesium chelatase subunit H
MQKLTLANKAPEIRVSIITMDSHLASATARALNILKKQFLGLSLSTHAASEWATDANALARCKEEILNSHIIIVTMLFMEDHFLPVLEILRSRRENCDAMVCVMSAAEITKLTRMGKLDMSTPATGALAFLKKLRGKKNTSRSGGEEQMQMLRRIPQILRFIPGTAQDVRAYFLTLQYWLGGSEQNIANLIRMLIGRYATAERYQLRTVAHADAPVNYPDIGLYHPSLLNRISTDKAELIKLTRTKLQKGRVGLLLLRSYLLAGNTSHYDGVIKALEARGIDVIPAFATGLDARPAIESFFIQDGVVVIDALVSLTGFSLVGGPAYNDAHAAEKILTKLDVPYIAAHPVEFQMLDDWENSSRGLLPVESTMMVAIPELDGATSPMVFGGRVKGNTYERDMQVHHERAATLAKRVEKVIALKKSERFSRKIAIVIFNFPPNAGNVGTAAHLSVFESLFNTLQAMQSQGYKVDIPDCVQELQAKILQGNASQFGAAANVHVRIKTDDHVRQEVWLSEIESQWGSAPGKQLSDGISIHVLGAQFGNVFVGIQPSMGYEGDPMRLLFENGFSPTHAFSAFYRYIKEDFGAHAILHFGTHGSLEFMPGKQTGLSADCWPDRLIGDVPNFYLYAANNPSEGSIAKRRANATLISYLTPPICKAGLYKELSNLKNGIQQWRSTAPSQKHSLLTLIDCIQKQATHLQLIAEQTTWPSAEIEQHIQSLWIKIIELEETMIPYGLHIVGGTLEKSAKIDMLVAIASAAYSVEVPRSYVEQLVCENKVKDDFFSTRGNQNESLNQQYSDVLSKLKNINHLLDNNSEIEGILHALDGHFVAPAPGGDVLNNIEILPTGRNLHGFDPFRIPSGHAVQEGFRQANRLLDRYKSDGHPIPESIALVLWGTDNLKSGGIPVAQALALLGTKPRFDSYGRLAGAELIDLKELGRPRIDVVMTLSGIFRDLLPLQIKLLAEAAFLAVTADEPVELNFIKKHALQYQQQHDCDIETAALRVFGNADGTYGANVNHLIDSSRWENEDELAETYSRRKGFAYGKNGQPQQHKNLLQTILADVSIAYQNLDSVELGITTVDTYFDTLGGISRAIKKAKGGLQPSVYISDQTRGDGVVRTLAEQVALETRTRTLNPKWYEGMLNHGYEGVRQIETHVTNTMGWSATTGQVAPWVYRQITQTFMLDNNMRNRLAELNPTASAKVANRLLEACERKYWTPSTEELEALRSASEELEDRVEGVFENATA